MEHALKEHSRQKLNTAYNSCETKTYAKQHTTTFHLFQYSNPFQDNHHHTFIFHVHNSYIKHIICIIPHILSSYPFHDLE